MIGALGLHSVVNHWKDIEPPLQSLIIFIIVLGCFLFVLGALGMFGACTKNVCLLTTVTKTMETYYVLVVLYSFIDFDSCRNSSRNICYSGKAQGKS